MSLAVAHTAQLDPATLDAARLMVDGAFPLGEFTEEDWDHALGGMHAITEDGGRVIAHGAVVLRRFIHRGRTLRVGYVEAVAVAPDVRRRGHASAVMEALETIIRGGYDLGALSASDAAARLYRSRGWQLWRGPTWEFSQEGLRRTPDEDGAVHVFRVGAELDLDGALVCDWREGDSW